MRPCPPRRRRILSGAALASAARGSVATAFGYSSESAFSNAFKRMTGHPPAHHRRLAAQDDAEEA
jgi:transcriptional regulator GlxA family with amidase domain